VAINWKNHDGFTLGTGFFNGENCATAIAGDECNKPITGINKANISHQ